MNEIEQEAEQKKEHYPKKKKEMKEEDDRWMEENVLKFERRAPKNSLNSVWSETKFLPLQLSFFYRG
ncbi:MAG: hypothetical protein AB8G05_05815 [Oligoflexales bacterium]